MSQVSNGMVNRHQSAEHRIAAYRVEAPRFEHPRHRRRAGILANRRRDVAIGIGIAVQHPAEHARRRPQIREVRGAHERFDGRLKSSDSSCPPGVSTRQISSIAAARSGTLRRPYPVVTISNEPAGNGSAIMSPTRNRCAGAVRLRALTRASSIIRSVMSRPTTRAPRAGERKGDVAGTGGEVERAAAGARRRQRDQPPLPASILAVRQQRR